MRAEGFSLPTVEIEHPGRRKRNILLAVVVGLLVLVAGLAIWFSVDAYNKNQASRQVKAYKAMLSTTQSLLLAGKNVQAEEVATKYLATNPPKKYRPEADAVMGLAFISDKQPAKALEWYKREVQDAGSLSLQAAMDIAGAARQTGDKATAIKYYQDAIPLWRKQQSPDTNEQVQAVQANIKFLQSGS